MSDDFGDFVADDAVGLSEPDPEALARIFIIEYRTESKEASDPIGFDDLDQEEQVILTAVFRRIIDRLRQEWFS